MASKADSLEDEMSRFEREILGTTSSRPPPQPLLGVAPSVRPPVPLMQSSAQPRPLITEGGPLLAAPNTNSTDGGLLQTPGHPKPLFQPSQTTGPRPLLTQPSPGSAPRPLLQPAASQTAPGFVPRQATTRTLSPTSLSSVTRAPTPLMGRQSATDLTPAQATRGGSPRMPHPGQTHYMPPPGFKGPAREMPSGQQRLPPPPPGMIAGPLGQPPPRGMFPPRPQFPPRPMFNTMAGSSGMPQLQSYTQRPGMTSQTIPTPLNPLAIAQAVAGATGSSGMSASGSGGPVSLSSLPIPKRGGKGPKVRTDPKKLRVGGGKVWEDHSLDDWDSDDFRIFVGDLGNDVNDDTLARSFSRFSTFLKAKVIRDKYTKKTKGYGFVSFKDPKDFMQAMREMNGKYIGNRPIKLRKSTWKDRGLLVTKKKEKEKKRLGFK